MKKFLTLAVALVMVIPMMAVGRNDGSTKANAKEFDWGRGIEHEGGTLWYRVKLDSAGFSLYEQENPSLTLYLTNPSNVVGSSVDVSMQATVAGQSESKSYTIAARQYKTYTANASMLVRMKQTEIYLTLTSNGKIKLSAKVFETEDLDETCQDARTLAWSTVAVQDPMYSAWWKVSLKPIKNATNLDAQITITNTGSKTVNLKVGQSLDCPSSGVTRRLYELPAGESIVSKVPRDMIASVQPDELYFSVENVESQVSILVETVAQPLIPVIPDAATLQGVNLHVTDTIEPMPETTTLYKVSVADMDSLTKYEPEFTYRNVGTTPAKVTIKMAFNRPAFGTSDVEYDLAAGEEEIVVYKKNMLEGMADVDSIYLLTTVQGTVNFYGRFKHVREGKACKTNIDFNWESGHTQEARTIQWYAIPVKEAKDSINDIRVHVTNEGTANATVKASMAFSCPYIDLQEVTRKIEAGKTQSKTIGWSTFALTSDTIWMGIETNQDISFRAEMIKTQVADEPDTICLHADTLSWENGALQEAGDTVWYVLDMKKVRDLKTFPMVYVYNYGTGKATIEGELSLECPDSIPNQKKSVTIEKDGVYSRQIARTMFQNIDTVYEYIYLRVVTDQKIKFEVRFTEAAEGSDCGSAIRFNWGTGNSQKANENLWYEVDLRDVMLRGNDLKLHIENRDNTTCKGVVQLSYECPVLSAPSIQNFTLAANAEKKVMIQNSALETLTDSVVYVNLQGTTGLRFWADTLEVEPFDTIKADGITLIPLQWDTLYTQSVDTAWYIISKEEIDRVRNMDDQVKPVAHLYNLSTSQNTIKAEAAYAFPITKNMMTKSQDLKSKQHYSDTIPASTFEQIIGTKENPKKDSVILRVTRPVGSADFQFKAELVKAFSGNSRNDALPIRMGERYTQSPNTEMWYKINTTDWKKDKTLYNKVLNVMTKNAGKGDAKVSVSVYEGLLSETDMLEEYGLNDYRERTVKKGQGKNHNIPAQAVYALGDVELYVKVRTTDSLVFESKFVGVYEPQAVDPKQKEAKLVVPNVDYIVPADGEEHWYMVCVPYINAQDSKDGKIKRNYQYIAESSLTYELNGKATIEVTGTFQDEMDCAMPVRKRTINKNGGYHKGTKPLWELINKGIKKASGREFDVSTFQPSFVDSMLHVYLTSDSITGYIRIKTDKELKVRLNTPQITGGSCDNAMMFDWEHGNVNAADSTTWYQVVLVKPDSTLIIPDSTDVRIYVENWSDTDNEIAADLYFDCNEASLVHRTRTIAAGGLDSIDIDRDRLDVLKSNMLINFSSTQTAHIWAALIDTVPRDTLCDTIRAFVCYGGSFIDTVRYNQKTIDPVEKDTMWTDTVTFADGVVMKDSLTTFILRVVLTPELITVDSMKKLEAAPMLVQGMQLYVNASNDSLMTYYKAQGEAYDTIINIDTVYWAKPVYKTSGELDIKKEKPLDLTTFYPKTQDYDTLLLVIKGGCDQVIRKDYIFPLKKYKYVSTNDTLCTAPVQPKDTITYEEHQHLVPDTLGLDRQIDTIVTHHTRVLPTLYTQEQLSALPTAEPRGAIDTLYTLTLLKQKFEDDAEELTMKVTDAKWQVQLSTGWSDDIGSYVVAPKATSVTMRYVINTECGNELNSGNILIPVACENDTIFDPLYPTGSTTACDSLYWALKDTMIYDSGTYYYNGGSLSAAPSCDEIYQLTVTILHHTVDTVKKTICDTELPYEWKGVSYSSAGTYQFDTLNVAGCDSTITLVLKVLNSTKDTVRKSICDTELPYEWKGISCPSAGDYVFDTLNVAGCDSTITLVLTVLSSYANDEYATICANELPYLWKGISCPSAGDYVFDTLNVAGCDSTITLHLTVNPSYEMPVDSVNSCNLYEWRGITYTESGLYFDSLTTVNGCDSVYTLKLTINGPAYVDSLDIKAYYGYRIVMINRNQINQMQGWQLDSLDVEHPEYVTWHEIDLSGNDKVVGDGYYYNLENGEPLPTGYQYYAVIDVPASASAECGVQGKTKTITVGATAAAPALVPSLAKPGETIQVINLDPEVETTIRLFTAEGLLQKTYRSYGQESFSIKAAGDMGFYLVELSADNMKSTLRYIVK